MRLTMIAGLLTSLALSTLAGCGGPKQQAVAPETNPWADYKGTYASASTAPPKSSPSEARAEKADASKAALIEKAAPVSTTTTTSALVEKTKPTAKKPAKAASKKSAPRAKS